MLLEQKDLFNVSYMTATQSKMHAGIKILLTLYSHANLH